MTASLQPMTATLQPILAAVRLLTPNTSDGWDKLLAAYREYTGKRAWRSAAEQNVFGAVQQWARCVITPGYSQSTAHRLMDEVFQECAILEATPLVPVDIGPTITPQEWASENPQSLLSAIRTVLRVVEADGDEDVLEGAVHHLREALLDEARAVLVEVTVAEAAHDFVRAFKAHTMFGDSLEAAVEKLNAVLYPARPAVDPAADEPYLYVLMRNDLASLNAGKAVAQGTHASNQMVFEATIATDPMSQILDSDRAKALSSLIQKWSTVAHGFGTCIVKSVNEAEMREAVAAAKAAGLHAGITHDPSYPLRDGASFHLIPLDTCGYVFSKKADATPFVGKFPLMP